MNSIELLIQQLETVNVRLHHTAGDLTRDELVAQPLPTVNPIGFIVWHMVGARTGFQHRDPRPSRRSSAGNPGGATQRPCRDGDGLRRR
jgi:hypothetical protein